MVQESAQDAPDAQMQNADETRKKEKTMRIAIAEGCFGIGSNTVNDNFLVPFALAIGSTPFQVGLLTALPGIIAPIGQVTGSHRMYSQSRGKIILRGIGGMVVAAAIVLGMAIVAMTSTGTWGFL